jgi:hypothetical protein
MNVKKQSVFYVILNILQGMKLEILIQTEKNV